MIPLLAAATKGDTLKKAGLILGAVTVLGVGIWYFNKQQKKRDYVDAEKNYGQNTKNGLAVSLASRLKTAMSGMGTNEAAMYDVARSIAQYNKSNGLVFGDVAAAYRKLYNDDLLKEINSELNSPELKLFQKYLTQ